MAARLVGLLVRRLFARRGPRLDPRRDTAAGCGDRPASIRRRVCGAGVEPAPGGIPPRCQGTDRCVSAPRALGAPRGCRVAGARDRRFPASREPGDGNVVPGSGFAPPGESHRMGGVVVVGLRRRSGRRIGLGRVLGRFSDGSRSALGRGRPRRRRPAFGSRIAAGREVVVRRVVVRDVCSIGGFAGSAASAARRGVQHVACHSRGTLVSRVAARPRGFARARGNVSRAAELSVVVGRPSSVVGRASPVVPRSSLDGLRWTDCARRTAFDGDRLTAFGLTPFVSRHLRRGSQPRHSSQREIPSKKSGIPDAARGFPGVPQG